MWTVGGEPSTRLDSGPCHTSSSLQPLSASFSLVNNQCVTSHRADKGTTRQARVARPGRSEERGATLAYSQVFHSSSRRPSFRILPVPLSTVSFLRSSQFPLCQDFNHESIQLHRPQGGPHQERKILFGHYVFFTNNLALYQ